MESKKQATCSLIFPLQQLKFWYLGILYYGGTALLLLCRDKAGSNLGMLMPRLNIAPISAFVRNMDSSSGKLFCRLAADKLSIAKVMP